MLNTSKLKKIDCLHNHVNTLSIARIANRLVFDRFSETNQEYLFVVNDDLSTDVIPLRQGFPLSLLNQGASHYYHITNREKIFTVSYIHYANARKYMFLEPRITFPLKKDRTLFGTLKDLGQTRYT